MTTRVLVGDPQRTHLGHTLLAQDTRSSGAPVSHSTMA